MKILVTFGIVFVACVVAALANATTITVDTSSDVAAADGFCSLPEAIHAANGDIAYNDCPAGSGSDLIDFDLPTSTTILLLANLPTITDTVLIRGPGPQWLTIDGGEFHRLLEFRTSSGGWLGVEGLTLTNGLAADVDTGGGGAFVGPGETAFFRRVNFINNRSVGIGGGLAVDGGLPATSSSVTIVECYFAGNVSEGGTGGGGLATSNFYANARVVRSTFFDNHDASAGGSGGAISIANSDLTVESSTLTGNRANNNGGGIGAFMNNMSALAIRLNVIDSTITANQSEANGGTVGDGGGIFMQASTGNQVWLKLQNSVVAGNLDSGTANQPDLSCGSGSMMSIGGSSFVGSNEGCDVFFEAGTPNAAGNFVGTNAFPLDPLLQPLAFHGGTTPVHHPEYDPASPLIDQGACSGEIIDQRLQGNPLTSQRPVDVPGVLGSPGGDDCDIGAVEVFAEPNTDPRVFLDNFESSTTLFWASQ